MFGFDKITERVIEMARAGRAPSHLANPNIMENGELLHGVFDDNKMLLRSLWVDGINYFVVNKAWVDSGHDDGYGFTLPPWGSYPPKPKASRKQ